MNERIKELAKQVGWSGFEALDERNEKFAELIINDCLDVLCEEMDKLGIDLSDLPKWYKVFENTETNFGIR